MNFMIVKTMFSEDFDPPFLQNTRDFVAYKNAWAKFALDYICNTRWSAEQVI